MTVVARTASAEDVETVSDAECVGAYEQLYLIRAFELGLSEAVANDALMSRHVLLSVGQEAISVGVVAALDRRDRLALTYRSHATLLARGADITRLAAEVLGRQAGYCGGRAGGHVLIPEIGNIDTSVVVGAAIPTGTGSALASWIDSDSCVTACFFGDGAVSEGAFHEALNMAALWRLPIVYICENNRMATNTGYTSYSPVGNVADRAAAYGIPAVGLNGHDPFVVRAAARAAVARARTGEGPTLLECATRLLIGHFANAASPQHAAANDLPDPLLFVAAALEKRQLGTSKRALEQQVDARVRKGIEAALASPFPEILV
jgi:pyruvate dehydrogenase E1 component alpha subunit